MFDWTEDGDCFSWGMKLGGKKTPMFCFMNQRKTYFLSFTPNRYKIKINLILSSRESNVWIVPSDSPINLYFRITFFFYVFLLIDACDDYPLQFHIPNIVLHTIILIVRIILTVVHSFIHSFKRMHSFQCIISFNNCNRFFSISLSV